MDTKTATLFSQQLTNRSSVYTTNKQIQNNAVNRTDMKAINTKDIRNAIHHKNQLVARQHWATRY